VGELGAAGACLNWVFSMWWVSALPLSLSPSRSNTPLTPSPKTPKVFNLFDRDHSDRISTEELATVLCGGSADDDFCIPDAVPAALRRVDADNDGFVDFGEFLNMVHTSDADALELFPSRRLRRGAKRVARAPSVEQRRRGAEAS
jgi:hypothetical protein